MSVSDEDVAIIVGWLAGLFLLIAYFVFLLQKHVKLSRNIKREFRLDIYDFILGIMAIVFYVQIGFEAQPKAAVGILLTIWGVIFGARRALAPQSVTPLTPNNVKWRTLSFLPVILASIFLAMALFLVDAYPAFRGTGAIGVALLILAIVFDHQARRLGKQSESSARNADSKKL